jgi:RHS repeat-associated protein
LSVNQVISNDIYGLDQLNRLKTETKQGTGARTINYDKTDQVQTVTGSNSEAYTYDQNGNRTNSGYATDSGNRLTSDGTYSYQYDPEGNRKSRTNIVTQAVDEYTWDYRNRLTGIVSKDSGGAVIKTVGYTYDVDDQRVSKMVTTGTGSTTEKYYLDGNQIAFVTDGSGNQMFHYLYGLNVDQVMAQDSPTGMVWALADRLGSVETLTDGEGVVVDQRTFDSFGRVLSESNPSVQFRYGYTGRELDLESGLNYYRARYYDPANGRFISVDPMGFGAGDTNLYRYVGNSSTNATDPSGMWLNFAVGAAIGGGLDLGVQLWQNGGDLSNINWGSVGVSTLTGAIGGGIGGFLSKQGVGLAARTAITAGAEFNLGYWGKVAENKVTGKDDLFDGAFLSGAIGGVSGAGGELLQAGAGAAWKKYGSSITSGAKSFDQWGGKTFQQFGRAIDNGFDLFSGSQLRPVFSTVGNGLDGSLAKPLSQQVGDGFQHVMAMLGGDIRLPNNALDSIGTQSTHPTILNNVPSQFNSLSNMRNELKLPNTGKRKLDGVLTKLELNDKEYFGINSWAGTDTNAKSLFEAAKMVNSKTGKTPFSAVANHAEGDVAFQAFKDKNLGGHGKLFIDAQMCGFCDKSGGVKSLARSLQLTSLEVFEKMPNGTIKYRYIVL